MVFPQTRTRTTLALLLLFLLPPANAQSGKPRQVIVISIDGMTPDEYEHPDQHQLSIPNLRAMRDAGCASPAMLEGFGYGTSLSGPLLSTPTNKGTHGYNPAVSEMHPSFILYGAGIAPCKSLPGVKIFDVGPTAAALLGASMKGTQGSAVDHVSSSERSQ